MYFSKNVLFICLAFICFVHGAAAETVHVTGTVSDSSTTGLIDSAMVYFVRIDTQEISHTATDASGRYSIDLPVGGTAVEDATPKTFRLSTVAIPIRSILPQRSISRLPLPALSVSKYTTFPGRKSRPSWTVTCPPEAIRSSGMLPGFPPVCIFCVSHHRIQAKSGS